MAFGTEHFMKSEQSRAHWLGWVEVTLRPPQMETGSGEACDTHQEMPSQISLGATQEPMAPQTNGGL